MAGTWKTGVRACRMFGLRYDPTIVRLAHSRFLDSEGKDKPDMAIDTTMRDGDFLMLLEEAMPAVRRKARRRPIWVAPDDCDEWNGLMLWFGSRASVMSRLRERAAVARARWEARQFHGGSISPEEAAKYGRQFGGERKNWTWSVWYERPDAALWFVGVGAGAFSRGPDPEEGKRVFLTHGKKHRLGRRFRDKAELERFLENE